MTEEQIEEYNTSLKLFAGISLPGIIGRASSFATPEELAIKAYDIAEAMMIESKKREPKPEEECTQE